MILIWNRQAARTLILHDRMVSVPGLLGGKACVQGTRLSVGFLLELMASGATQTDIITAYPHLTPEDISEALRYAARYLENEIIITAKVAA